MQDSPPAAGRSGGTFLSAAVRSSQSVTIHSPTRMRARRAYALQFRPLRGTAPKTAYVNSNYKTKKDMHCTYPLSFVSLSFFLLHARLLAGLSLSGCGRLLLSNLIQGSLSGLGIL